MKNETVGTEKAEGKAAEAGATLPGWARLLMAQHSIAATPRIDPHRLHHCSDCGCVLISTNVDYQYFSDLCPECSAKKRKSQGEN